MGLRDLSGQPGRAGKAIDEFALRGGAQQGLVGMLAVDVDQVFADILQLLHGRRTAVDVCARTARRFDDSAQETFAVVAGEVVFPEVSRQRGNPLR